MHPFPDVTASAWGYSITWTTRSGPDGSRGTHRRGGGSRRGAELLLQVRCATASSVPTSWSNPIPAQKRLWLLDPIAQ